MTKDKTGKQRLDHAPPAKLYPERIGGREYMLPEVKLDVANDVLLWHGNPRLQQTLAEDGALGVDEDLTELDEHQLEERIRRTKGYDALARNIADLGQLEPIYVWRRPGSKKYLVLEGATRVTILRELTLEHQGKPDGDQYRYAIAKVLPAEFSEEHRTILLARIHVRGAGVRQWGRYIEAKFIWETVTERNGHKPLLTMGQLAEHMGKSLSWVSRLKDAYEFALAYIEHLDDTDAKVQAREKFSILEEISRVSGFGPKVKALDKHEYDGLRDEVFQMVRNNVFKEYRDARFIGEFHDDPEKWQRLLTLEPGAGHELANQVKAGVAGVKGRIDALYGQIERQIDKDASLLDEDDLEKLKKATRLLESRLLGLAPFRIELREFTKALENVPLSEVKALTAEEYKGFQTNLADFQQRLEKYKSWQSA